MTAILVSNNALSAGPCQLDWSAKHTPTTKLQPSAVWQLISRLTWGAWGALRARGTWGSLWTGGAHAWWACSSTHQRKAEIVGSSDGTD